MRGIQRPEGDPLEPIPMLHVEVCPDRTTGKFRIEINRQYLFAWGMDEDEANLYASFLRTFVDWFDARAMAQYEAKVTTASKTVE